MMYGPRDFRPGDLVWFDPGVGYVLPGEVLEFHKAAQVITVQAVINNITKTFTLNNLSSVKTRQDLGQNGVEDMVTLSDLNEASILWNLRIRQGYHPQKPKGGVIHVKTSTGTTTATSTPTSARSS